MATSFARSAGANARAISWDQQDEPQRGRGNWLPLDALSDEELYQAGPRLQQTAAAPRHGWSRQASTAHRQTAAPRTAQHHQQKPATRPQQQASTNKAQAKTLAIAAGAILCALAAYVVVSSAVAWAQVKMDDMKYGRPRTMQMDAYVGHNEAEGMPSHFIAMNLNRRVTIMQLQGSDPTKATTIVGPYLFGQGEDLTPVELDISDANTDGKPDLVVSVKSEQLLYLNDGSNFRLATPEERAAISRISLQAQAASPKAPQTELTEGTK